MEEQQALGGLTHVTWGAYTTSVEYLWKLRAKTTATSA